MRKAVLLVPPVVALGNAGAFVGGTTIGWALLAAAAALSLASVGLAIDAYRYPDEPENGRG